MATEVKQRAQYTPPPKVERDASKPKQLINRRKRERMDDDAEYLALRDCFIEENPKCAMCPRRSRFVHHICSGTAGRPISLKNPNTWIENCSDACGARLDAMPFEQQVSLKVKLVRETIARLRT